MRSAFLSVLLASAIIPVYAQQGKQAISRAPQSEVNWIGPNADWQPQDYFDSRGISAARFENGRLVLTAKLILGDVNFSKGEVLLDTKFFPELDCLSPVDFRSRELTIEIEVPATFAGTESNPSRLYLFAKDKNYESFYGPATNVSHSGKFTLTLKFSDAALLEGYSEALFDPAMVRLIGVKFELGDGAVSPFQGQLFINRVTVNPPIMAANPPNLPISTPLPVILPGDKIEARDGAFYLNDKKWFVIGANWRLTEYGQNFGITEWFPAGNGVATHPNFTRINLEYARRSGIKLLRVGLLEDGRVVFDRDGRVVRYDDTFRKDVRTLLNLAQQVGIGVELVLFDFHIAGRLKESDRVFLGGRRNIFINPTLRANFRADFLVPFLKDFGNHPALFGFDLVNEPEWFIKKAEGGGLEDYNTPTDKPPPETLMEEVPREALNAYLIESAADIRQFAPGKLITVGVSAKFLPLVNTLSSLSYLAPHHYHWMGDLRNYMPLFNARAWSLEEFPTKFDANAVPDGLKAYFDLGLELRSSGAMFWNLTPAIDDKTCPCLERPARLAELQSWAASHAADIYPQTRPVANVSAASFIEAELTSEMIVASFGNGLANATLSANTIPLPDELAGTRVRVKDNAGTERLAKLFFISPTQLNYLIPKDTSIGIAMVTVTSGDNIVSSSAIQISTVAPGIFTASASGTGLPAAEILRIKPGDVRSTESIPQVIDLGPAGDQVYLTLYCTGIRNRSSLDNIIVTIGGTPVGVLYAGLTPGFEGLDQINIGPLPRSLAGRGIANVVVAMDGKIANTVQITIK